MRTPKYIFLLDGQEALPHYKQLKKKYTKENQQNFFTETLEGKITLHGADYNYVKESPLESVFTFEIKMLNYNTNLYEPYFKTTFSKTDCKFNIDKQQLELNLEKSDAHSGVLDVYDNKYDLIKLAPAITSLFLYKRPLVQIYIKGSSSISNFIGGTYWESDTNETVDDKNKLVNTYHFAYYKTLNEICISNANNPNINGVYAGSNGFYNNNKGYIIQATATTLGMDLYIYKSSDITNKLYASLGNKILVDSDELYIPSGFEFTFASTTSSTDRFKTEYVFEYAIFQRLLCDVSSIKVGDTVLNTYELPLEDISNNKDNYKYAIGLKSNDIYITSKTVDEPTRYGMDDYEKYFTNAFLPLSAGIERVLPVCRSIWANASIWFSYSLIYEQYEQSAREKYKLKHAYTIANAIKAILKKLDIGITHEATSEYSEFLYGSSNPLHLAHFQLLLTPTSNILKGEYDEPAKKGEISLKTILDMLRDCFRCYWFIDNGKLRIEHISWFMKGRTYGSAQGTIGIDLTSTYMDKNNKALSFFQNNIEYNKNDIPQRYEFSWAEGSMSELFDDIYIDIKSNYVTKGKTETISVDSFVPDVDLMLLEPSKFSNDSFALLGAVMNNSSMLELPIVKMSLTDEDGSEYTASIQNGYLSWAYLLNYYMYDMPSINIKSSVGLQYTVRGLANTMLQRVKFPWPVDPSVYEFIRTDMGNGVINSMSIDFETRQVEVELAFKPI